MAAKWLTLGQMSIRSRLKYFILGEHYRAYQIGRKSEYKKLRYRFYIILYMINAKKKQPFFKMAAKGLTVG